MSSYVKDTVFRTTMIMPTSDKKACTLLLKKIAGYVKNGAVERMEDGVMETLKEVTKNYLKEEKNQKVQNFRCTWLKSK